MSWEATKLVAPASSFDNLPRCGLDDGRSRTVLCVACSPLRNALSGYNCNKWMQIWMNLSLVGNLCFFAPIGVLLEL